MNSNSYFTFFFAQDFQSLRTGSLQYSQIDEPIYRVCVDPTSKLGNCETKFQSEKQGSVQTILFEVFSIILFHLRQTFQEIGSWSKLHLPVQFSKCVVISIFTKLYFFILYIPWGVVFYFWRGSQSYRRNLALKKANLLSNTSN